MIAISSATSQTAPERRSFDVEVRAVRSVTPHIKRITVAGPNLEGFQTTLPGQWVKLFVTDPRDGSRSGRAYTIRTFSAETTEMDIDFVIHGDGPCSTWAESAKIGDTIQIAGPRSGFQIEADTRHLLIGGDETALPAISSILESLPAHVRAKVVIEIPTKDDIQSLQSAADMQVQWLPREELGPDGVNALENAMLAAHLPANAEVWFAGETSVVRAVRQHLLVTMKLDRRRITASGYWKKGEVDFRDTEKVVKN